MSCLFTERVYRVETVSIAEVIRPLVSRSGLQDMCWTRASRYLKLFPRVVAISPVIRGVSASPLFYTYTAPHHN